jgi:hypothetical protein
VRLSVAAVVALAATGLAGCSATNTITTQKPYSASDGVRDELGDLTLENMLVIAGAADETGALQGALTNRGDDTLTVTIALPDGTEITSQPVRAGATVLLGGDAGEEVTFTSPDAPGAFTDLTVSTGQGGSQTLAVPVLDGTLPEYATLVPTTAPTPTATPTASATPTPTAEG